MAHIEPMDVESEFEDKENLIQVNNILSRTSCTEKGYEEMDVSEMSMRLRFSITPSSSPMSKSYTGNRDSKFYEIPGEGMNDSLINGTLSLTQSLNSTLPKVDNKVSKSCPLQPLATDLLGDISRNPLSQRSLDSSVIDPNITITVNDNVDENLSLPSTSSSTAQTPEATTPTKIIPKDGGSPILRGLKSVFSIFRSSTSPIPPLEASAPQSNVYDSPNPEDQLEPFTVSTPISSLKNKDSLSKRNSPLKESMVFNDDLEKELLWKDETTILFKDEKIPIHKLFLQPSHLDRLEELQSKCNDHDNSVEYLDLPHSEMRCCNEIATGIETGAPVNVTENLSAVESDSEFVDCETTFTKHELDVAISHANYTNTNDTKNIPFNKQIEHQEFESQQLNLPTSRNSFPLDTIIASDCKVPKDLITEKAEMFDYQSIEIATEISELNPSKLGNEQSTIYESIENNCVVEKTRSETLNIKASAMFECNSLSSLNTDMNNVCDQVKDTFDNDKSNAPDQPDFVDIHLKNLKNIEDLNIAIAEKNINANESKDTIDKTDIILDVPHNEGISQLIFDKENQTNLQTDGKQTIGCVNKEEIFGTVNNNNIPIPREVEMLENNETDTGGKDFNSESITVTNEQIMLSNTSLDEKLLQNLAETLTKTPNKLGNIIGNENICKELAINYMGEENNELEVKDTNELQDGTENVDRIFVEDETEISITNNECVSAPRNIPLIENVDRTMEDKPEISITNNEYDSTPRDISLIENVDRTLEDKPEISITNNEQVSTPRDIPLIENVDRTFVEDKPEINITNNENVSTPRDIPLIENVDRTFVKDKPEISITDNEYVSIPRDIPLPSDNELDQDINDLQMSQALADKNENIVNVTFETNGDFGDKFNNTNNNYELNKNTESNTAELEINDDIGVKFNNTNKNYELNKSTESNTAEVVSNGDNNIVCGNDSKLLMKNTITTKYVVDCNINSSITVDKHIQDGSTKNNVQFNEIKGESNVSDELLTNKENVHVSEISDKQAKEISSTFTKNLDLTLDLEDKYSDNIYSKVENNNLSEVNKFAIDVRTINTDTKPQILEKNGDIVQDSGVFQILSKNTSQFGPIIEDDEIITSTGSSPYVLVTEFGLMQHDTCDLEDIENPIENDVFETSPPISPKLTKKGYDINFDDIDDPFATKTKIRLSPTPETPIKINLPSNNTLQTKIEVKRRESSKNRRKSQQERKANKSKKNNASMDTLFTDEQLKINDSFDTVIAGVGVENVDIKIDNNTATINNSEVQVSSISNVVENSFNGKDLESGSTFINSRNNSVLEQKNIPTMSNIENEITIDTEKNSTITELEVNPTISGMENNDILTNSKEEHFLSELNGPIEMESNYPEFSEDIENTMSLLLFERKAENLLLSPKNDNQSNATFEVETSEINTKNDEKTETVESPNKKENQNFGKISSSEDIGFFSSKHIEDGHSVTDILTEDEDTIEGPFIEADICGEDFRECGKDNMMQFDSTPTPIPTNDENIDNDEMFIDAEAFEFLLNQNKTNIIADSGKESLFLKFDPLFAKRISSDGIVAALSKIQKRQNTPKRPTKTTSNDNFETELAKPGPSQMDSSYVVMDNSDVTSSKPMMVVNPAINPVVTPRKLTPSLNRRSLTFSSPAIAVIDRLLSLNGNNSLIDRNESIAEPGGQRNETDIAITQLRELLAEKEINVHNLRCESKELKDRLANLESQMKSIEIETEQRLRKIKNLNENLAEKTKINKSMAAVVEEYERTIASLISDIQQEKKCNAAERMKLVRERDEQTAHLSSMEVSFSDLHSKYEKSKQIILSMKANEDQYKKSLQEFDDSLIKMQSNYEFLKQHATSKLNHANQELEKINKAHESEVLKLNALIKRKDLHITSLEETLAQKTKANEELTAICDELINKVG